MNGPQHYQEAESILATVKAMRGALEGAQFEPVMVQQIQAALQVDAALAQVHATLALAAAEAPRSDQEEFFKSSEEWAEVLDG